MAKLGYCRISSTDQSLNRQLDDMRDKAGISEDNIYTDKQTGRNFKRPGYLALLKALRPGDTVVISELDRLGRNYKEIHEQWKAIEAKGAYINVLEMPVLNTDQVISGDLTMKFISDLVLSVLSYVAEQEANKNKQRQGDGIRAAKARQVRFGRPTTDQDKVDKVTVLVEAGTSVKEACELIGIKRRTYYNRIRTE